MRNDIHDIIDEANNNEESLISDVTLNSSFIINNEDMSSLLHPQTSQTLPAPVPCERRHLIPEKAPASKISAIWNYFGVYPKCPNNEMVNITRSKYAVCFACYNKYCTDTTLVNASCWEINIGMSKSTSKISTHLSSKHGNLFKQYLVDKISDASNRESNADDSSSISTANNNTFSNKDARNKITSHFNNKSFFLEKLLKWIVKGYKTLDEVESLPFREMLESLSSNVHHFSSKTIKEKIFLQEVIVREKLKEHLRGREVAITIDMWSSIKKEGYMALSASFINEAWEIENWTLNCQPFPGKHGAEQVRDKLYDLLQTMDIEHQNVICCVTDNDATMNSFANSLDFEWQGCLAHLINLVTNYVFRGIGIETTMKKCRETVGLFNQSNQLNEVLISAQNSLWKDRAPLQLIQDVVTRWWSTHSMLARLLKLKSPIQFMVAGNRMEAILTEGDWATIEMVDSFLSPFAKIQKFLEGEKYVTISFVPLLVESMRRSIDNLCSTEYVDLAFSMKEYFESRFGDGTEGTFFNLGIVRGERRIRKGLRADIYLAAACDPRTKLLGCIPSQDRKGAFQELIQRVAAVITSNPQLEIVPTDLDQSSNSQHSEDIFSDFLVANSISASTAIDTDFEGAGQPLTALEIAKIEVNQFLRLPVLPHTESQPANPLEWWKVNKAQFPNLSKIAKKLLSVPATSASSERIFSASGNLLTKKRNKLSGDIAAAIVFLHGSWQKIDDLVEKPIVNRKRGRDNQG